jgi:hypothetical protein
VSEIRVIMGSPVAVDHIVRHPYGVLVRGKITELGASFRIEPLALDDVSAFGARDLVLGGAAADVRVVILPQKVDLHRWTPFPMSGELLVLRLFPRGAPAVQH